MKRMQKNLARLLALAALASVLLTGCSGAENSSSESTSSASQSSGQSTSQSSSQYETFSLAGLTYDFEENTDLPQFTRPQAGATIAVMKTSMGDITFQFFPDQAPKAVENFLTHAQEGYYNGLKFHRVIKDFMIQGGDPKGNGTGGESIWGTPFEDEFTTDLFVFRGALAMANSGSNTNGSQFFIVQGAPVEEATLAQMKEGGWPAASLDQYAKVGGAPWLDQKHTVFGQVLSGMDVVDAIAAVETKSDEPVEPVIVEEIKVYTAQ